MRSDAEDADDLVRHTKGRWDAFDVVVDGAHRHGAARDGYGTPVGGRPKVALYVDCHGALVASDVRWERVLGAVRQNPRRLLILLARVLAGKAVAFKHDLASLGTVDVATLPVHEGVIESVRRARAEGRPVVLVTSASDTLAEDLARRLGLFDGVLVLTRGTERSAHGMFAAIVADATQRRSVGPGGAAAFDYIGGGRTDPAILTAARRALVVSRTGPLSTRDAGAEPVTRTPPSARDVISALRVHQWLKNVFLFVPLALVAHEISVPSVVQGVLAFVAFSLVASATYIFNDLLDIRSDRTHPSKRRRPFASGRLAIPTGIAIAAAAFAAGVATALLLPVAFQALLGLYILTTVSYSLILKRMLLIDVITLAGLHTLRIIAGGAAVGVEMSFWLLAFSMFFFFSLALTKRYTELIEVGNLAERGRTGRGYRYEDRDMLAIAGIGASFSAVLVLALYINAPTTLADVNYPWLMWPICPLMLYSLLRAWILARRKEMDEDPVWFALTDWRSQLTFSVTAATYIVAHYV